MNQKFQNYEKTFDVRQSNRKLGYKNTKEKNIANTNAQVRVDILEQINIVNTTSKLIQTFTGKQMQCRVGYHSSMQTANLDIELLQEEIVESIKQVLWYKQKTNSYMSKKINHVVDRYMKLQKVWKIPRIENESDINNNLQLDHEKDISHIMNTAKTERQLLYKIVATINNQI